MKCSLATGHLWTNTVMPQPHLPPEIIDYIIDFLHDQPDVLRNCCLVSKSFIDRTRKHLFRDIVFKWFHSTLEAWRETFPDSKKSPAHHARSLSVGCTNIVTDKDAKAGDWIESFSEVARLELQDGFLDEHSFHSFHVLSKVKHLLVSSVTVPPSELLGFIFSFPQLEDLDISDSYTDADVTDWCEPIVWPPNFQFPPLTGTLVLRPSRPDCITRLLLAVPGCLRFRKIIWEYHPEHLEGVMAVVERCSDTLERIDIARPIRDYPSTPSFDLSKAIKLKEVVFEFNRTHITWITAALNTITSRHTALQRISIHFHDLYGEQPSGEANGGEIEQQWMDLDTTLVGLCRSHARRMNAFCDGETDKTIREYMGYLLPKMTEEGLINAASQPQPLLPSPAWLS